MRIIRELPVMKEGIDENHPWVTDDGFDLQSFETRRVPTTGGDVMSFSRIVRKFTSINNFFQYFKFPRSYRYQTWFYMGRGYKIIIRVFHEHWVQQPRLSRTLVC